MADDRPTAKPSSTPPDPFAVWREWVTKSEHQMNAMLNEMMGTEQFARVSGGWVEAMTMFQQTMNENAQRYFEAVNVPTRTDVTELAERLTAVEDRLLRIEALLAEAVGRKEVAGQSPRPARTRRPPSESRAAEQPGAQGGDQLIDAVPASAASGSNGERTDPK